MPTGMSLALGGMAEVEPAVATGAEAAKLRKAFDVIDVDGSGTLEIHEVKEVFAVCSQNLCMSA